MSHKRVSQESFPLAFFQQCLAERLAGESSRRALQECPTRDPCRSFSQECHTKVATVFYKSILQESSRIVSNEGSSKGLARVSRKIVLQDCSVFQRCCVRVSDKSVLQGCRARVSSKSRAQECRARASNFRSDG